MKKLLLLLALVSTPLISQTQTMKCSDVDISTSASQAFVITCLDGGIKPPVPVCPPPLFYVVVSGWPRTDAQSTRMTYDPSEPIGPSTFDPSTGKVTFTALRNPACKVTVTK